MSIEQIGNTGIYQLSSTPVGDAGNMIDGNFKVVANILSSGVGGSLNNGISLPYNVGMGWASGIATGVNDAQFWREASGIIGQRTGLGNQEFRVYNTYTSATSHEFVAMGGSGNGCYVGTKKGSGGGSVRDLSLIVDGATKATINSSNNFSLPTSSTDNNSRINCHQMHIAGGTSQIQLTSRNGAQVFQLYVQDSTLYVFANSGNRVAISLDGTITILDSSTTIRIDKTGAYDGIPDLESPAVLLCINVGGTEYVFPGFTKAP